MLLAIASLLPSALSTATRPDPLLQERLFNPPKPGPSSRPERSWLGADCATSLPLPNASTLWLFGDTLVSGFAGGHRTAAGCAMPHQTVALQPDRQAPLQFSWRENKTSGEPLNFFWPQSSLERAVPCSDPFSETSSYWWVVAGIESSSANLAPGRLLLLAERVQGTPGQGLGFKVLGTSVIVVDNAADNPVQWSHRSVSLTTCGSASCETWSAGIVPAHGCGVDCVYLVGSTGSPSSGRGQSLLRGSLQEMLELRFDALELLCDDGEWRPWDGGTQSAAARSLFPQQSEVSLHFSPHLNRWLVPALDGFGGQHLLLWSTPSDDVRGPWTSTLAYTLPAPFSDIKHVYAYAAKLHPHLSDSPDELVMTYATNAWNMSELFAKKDVMIYTPQVLRTNLTSLYFADRKTRP